MDFHNMPATRQVLTRQVCDSHIVSVQDAKKGWKKPTVSDGLVEVVGLSSGYHTGLVLSGVTHGVRIAQCSRVRLAFAATGGNGKERSKVYMQLDGEPWKQEVPAGKNVEPFYVRLLPYLQLLSQNSADLAAEDRVRQTRMAIVGTVSLFQLGLQGFSCCCYGLLCLSVCCAVNRWVASATRCACFSQPADFDRRTVRRLWDHGNACS